MLPTISKTPLLGAELSEKVLYAIEKVDRVYKAITPPVEVAELFVKVQFTMLRIDYCSTISTPPI